jgi:hypothetical protein
MAVVTRKNCPSVAMDDARSSDGTCTDGGLRGTVGDVVTIAVGQPQLY